MKTRRIVSFIAAAVMCVGCMGTAGCSKEENSKSSGGAGETDGGKEIKEIRDIPSVELVKEMTVGWNLGNTLDATGTGLESEVAWLPSHSYTTKEMVDLLKNSGFNVFRVPTTWEGHMDENSNIDKEWMDRVQEVVDYGIDNDMFVILNVHHEEWHFPSHENADAAKEKLAKVWGQIAERFEGYDEHLIFEGLNEPRKKGTAVEWNDGDQEGRDVVNEFNQVFVETVRNSGGNNPKRHLMIPSYAASSSYNAMQDVKVPENDDKIIVSIHSYTPYNFALNTSSDASWSVDNSGDTGAVDKVFNDIESIFTSKGIPVIIGEFGSINRIDEEGNSNLEARVAHAKYFMEKSKEYGVPCIWWDNESYIGNGENFGIMERGNMPSWRFPEIVTALTGVEVE